jgi:hypothetical protein
MKSRNYSITGVISTLLVFVFSVTSLAQVTPPSKYRSNFNERKKSIMDANDMRATYHNYGQGGKVNPGIADEFSYEYPKNTRREYMLFQMVFIGAEVKNQHPTAPSRTFAVVDVANLRTDPNTQRSWEMNPISGYSNSNTNELARSDRGPGNSLGNTWPLTWPDKLENGGDGWPDSWNGFFGRNQFNADLEFFYRMSDDNYTNYNREGSGPNPLVFYPDSTDPTRGGLGLIVDTRILAWTQVLVANAHFTIFELFNDSSFDYDKVAFGLWIADYVGGGRGGQDEPEFDLLRSIAYLKKRNQDRPLFPTFFEGPIGQMGLTFLETPGNALDGIDNDADSYQYDVRKTEFFKSSNADLMTLLTTGGGGYFFNSLAELDAVLPEFNAQQFPSIPSTITYVPGDRLVSIDDNYNRIVVEYVAGATFKTRGLPAITLPANGYTVTLESFYENQTFHFDLIDNDFDGLIDENRPNHFAKSFFNNQGVAQSTPVKHINYRASFFSVGDTIEPGFVVSKRQIRNMIANNPAFAAFVSGNGGQVRNHYTSAPMIDESRGDLFDNDRDWQASNDDVGIEGDPTKVSAGKGDGLPTSGFGTNFPGEPNIDKTDVSETDLIGVSRARIFGSGDLQTAQDATNWRNYLQPGPFEERVGTDRDVFVTSSVFPLPRRSIERFAVAISAVQTKSPQAADDRRALNKSLDQARIAYESDYQFPVAPQAPNVKAVVSDRKVVLYWDTSSEQSYDRYIARLSGDGFDFEGYRVYRASDTGVNDVKTITDAFGIPLYRTPLAIFDIENDYSGLHPIDVNGQKYNLGNNSGLRRFFVDTTVHNGKEYFYAVTAFDRGYEPNGIAPSESPIQSTRESDGTFTLGRNVVRVRPAASQAGYISPENPSATPTKGSTSGLVFVDVVDPAQTKKATYKVVFEDTLIQSGSAVLPDTVRTKNFSLINMTSKAQPDTLVKRSTSTNGGDVPVVEGLRLRLRNELKFGKDTLRTRVVSSGGKAIHAVSIEPNTTRLKSSDYIIVFGQLGFGQSSAKSVPAPNSSGVIVNTSFPSIQTNFKVFNVSENREIEYAFRNTTRDTRTPNDPNNQWRPDSNANGVFNAYVRRDGVPYSDIVRFIEPYRGANDVATWKVEMSALVDGVTRRVGSRNPQPGDTIKIFTFKPFSSEDEFEFKIEGVNQGSVSNEQAKADLNRIKVVPNPYIVTSPYERAITSTSNQQQRELHFTHLPVPSVLRIFTVSGVMVREIKVEAGDQRLINGTYIWDMLTKDNLEISYGVYLFHVDAKGVGSKLGKFAVIK